MIELEEISVAFGRAIRSVPWAEIGPIREVAKKEGGEIKEESGWQFSRE